MSTRRSAVGVVLLGPIAPGTVEACREALGRTVGSAGPVLSGADAIERATSTDMALLWLLDGRAVLHPDALERLLAVRREEERPPVLLAGMLVDPRGRPLDDRLPAATEAATADVVGLVGRRLLPIRHATFAHLLVERRAFEEHGLPDEASFGPHAPVEWSSRVLVAERGYLVTRSVVTAPPAPPAPAPFGARVAGLRATVRMTRTPAWTRGEGARALAALLRPTR